MAAIKKVVDTQDIVKCCKNTVKNTVNNRLYLSILTMKNKLKYSEEYAVNSNSHKEVEKCNGGLNCHLHEFRDLKNVIVMTLIVEKINENTKFEVRPFDDHTQQNCEVTASYLRYIYNFFKYGKENRFNNIIIDTSNKLYGLYKDEYISFGVGPRNNSNEVREVKAILSRSNPVINGVSFSNIVKSGIEDPALDSIDLNEEEFPDFENLIDQIAKLRQEKDDFQEKYTKEFNKNSELEKVIQDQESHIKKLNSDMLLAKSKINKYQVMLGSIRSNVAPKQSPLSN